MQGILKAMTYRCPGRTACKALRGSTPCLALALLLTALVNARPGHAYPQLYVGRVARTDCLSHPQQAYGRHQEPIVDSSTSITISAADAQAVTASSPSSHLCTDTSYTINIHFGERPRSALVTTNTGTLKASEGSATWVDSLAQAVADLSEDIGVLDMYTEQCPGRFVSLVTSTSLELTLSVPADATGDLELKVTSAANAADSFKTATVTTPIFTRQQCEDPEKSPLSSPTIDPSATQQVPTPSPSPSPAVQQPNLNSSDPSTTAPQQPINLSPIEVSTKPLEPHASTAVGLAPASTEPSIAERPASSAAQLPAAGTIETPPPAQGLAIVSTQPEHNPAVSTGAVQSSQATSDSQLLGQIAAANSKAAGADGTHTGGNSSTSDAAGWRRLLLRGITLCTMTSFVTLILLAP